MTGIGSGRLPTKHTTRHIKDPVLPEGAVNSRGWKKVIDNETGRAKYIDAKIGMAMDNNGDVTHKRF